MIAGAPVLGWKVLPADSALAAGRHDAVIDVRSPAEFAEDHLPDAVNWPVLDDDERRTVGTLYAQVSPLEARKVGAAMVARNIARHLDAQVRALPRDWRPLVYCWRGGQRSTAMAWFLSQVGFSTAQLGGGYKAFRSLVRTQLDALPGRFDFDVVCGRTGSGKTRLLHALARQGAQVLDLEALAEHRGSILGALPGRPQPSQKHFDTRLWSTLRGFDTARAVFVESESARIGLVRVPEPLLLRMRGHGRCVLLQTDDAARVQLLLRDYAFFADAPEVFCRLLDGLVDLRGRAAVAAWQLQARSGDWAGVFGALMHAHYDPLYLRSMRTSYPQLAQARQLRLSGTDDASLDDAATRLLAADATQCATPCTTT